MRIPLPAQVQIELNDPSKGNRGRIPMPRTPRAFAISCLCCADDSATGAGPSRRAFLATGVAAATAGTLGALGVSSALAQTTPAADVKSRRIIDVHHHIAPPSYLAETRTRQNPPTVGWSVAKSIDDMDKAGVATSITSITTPGVWFGEPAQARRLARECNDYAARLAQDHPGRFGVFASLPLPDVDASLREIEYVFDTLNADGVGLLTSFGDKWLGDPAFDPVMDELNRRKAVVYTHPTTANCCRNLVPDIQPAMIEYGTDTTRAIASILFRGTVKRCPDIEFVFSHAGGTMPFLIERFTRLFTPQMLENTGGGVEVALKRFYYDIAQASHRIPLGALVQMVSTSRIVFGTDFPFRTAADHEQGLINFGFNESELSAINRDNALQFLPRFKA
jgi:6-methylsalicylate decarboxylase